MCFNRQAQGEMGAKVARELEIEESNRKRPKHHENDVITARHFMSIRLIVALRLVDCFFLSTFVFHLLSSFRSLLHSVD